MIFNLYETKNGERKLLKDFRTAEEATAHMDDLVLYFEESNKGSLNLETLEYSETKYYCEFADGSEFYCIEISEEAESGNDLEIRVTFRSEVYISGKNMEEIREKWNDLPLFSADALERYNADFVELVSAERVDDGSYEDVSLDY